MDCPLQKYSISGMSPELWHIVDYCGIDKRKTKAKLDKALEALKDERDWVETSVPRRTPGQAGRLQTLRNAIAELETVEGI